ncbi:hypothetical protein SUGI_0559130 [Cryptomeria japonica]|nr:hypothetical protein SUGI_0559130 [Cryptomeria japonica]
MTAFCQLRSLFSVVLPWLLFSSHFASAKTFSTEGKVPSLDLSDLPSFIKKKPITKSRGFTADEEVTTDQLGSVPVSVESATTSTSHGYDKDSDYDHLAAMLCSLVSLLCSR